MQSNWEDLLAASEHHLPIKFQDVFVPGGFPSHTYNPRSLLKLEDKLQKVRNNLCKLAIVTGHTKSGKTVSDSAKWKVPASERSLPIDVFGNRVPR